MVGIEDLGTDPSSIVLRRMSSSRKKRVHAKAYARSWVVDGDAYGRVVYVFGGVICYPSFLHHL